MSIEASVRAWNSGVGGTDLLVLLALADFAGGVNDPFGHAYPSVGRLAKMCQVSPRTVQRSLRELEKVGVISRHGTHEWTPGVATNVYRIDGRQALDVTPDNLSPLTQVSPNPPTTFEPSSVIAEVEVQELAMPRASASNHERELFAYWQKQTGHDRAKATPERLRAIRARLKDGYSVEDIRQAIDGAAVGAFVDERGKRHDDLTLICRSGSRVEDFAGRAASRPPSQLDQAFKNHAEILELERQGQA